MKKNSILSLFLSLIIIFGSALPVKASSPFLNVNNEQSQAIQTNIDNSNTYISFPEFAKKFVLDTTYNHGEDPVIVLKNKKLITAEDSFLSNNKLKRVDALNIIMRSLGYYLPKEQMLQKAVEEKLIKEYSSGSMDEDKFISSIESDLLIQNYKINQLKKYPNTQVQKYPIAEFLKLPQSFGYSLSGDGNFLLYGAPWQNVINIFMKDLTNGQIYQLTYSTDNNVTGVAIKNDTVLYLKDFGGNENYHIFKTDDTGKEIDLTPYPDTTVGIIDINYTEQLNDEIYVLMNKDNKQLFSIYKLNVVTGVSTLFYENKAGYSNFILDNNGFISVAEKSDGISSEYYYRKSDKEDFKLIKSFDSSGTLEILTFMEDNKTAYAISNINSDTTALVKIDIPTGTIIEEVYRNPEVDLHSIIYGPKHGTVGGVVFYTDKPDLKFFDKDLLNLHKKISSLLNTSDFIFIGNYSFDFKKFIITTQSDVNRGIIYLYDYANNKVQVLSDLNNIPSNTLSRTQSVSYKSRDGLTIHGYLTLPRGVEAKNLPVIINPHGGPWTRDYLEFNPEVQLLANHGYAVLQMNFRGSTGYGKNFLNKGNKQWGLNMQNDITDGVNWLIDIGIADPEKIGIYGASYGGYATLAGVTLTPDLYAAAVDYVGVSNLFTFMETLPPYWEISKKMMYERVGNPVTDKEQFIATSPVFHADKIRTPLFIAQGANDPRVNRAESDQMVEALKKNNIPHEYLLKEDEGHGFKKYENQLEFYTKMLNFLDKHLKN